MFFCDPLLPVQETSGLPEPAKHVPGEKRRKKNIRKRKAANYAGIKVKQLSSFRNPTLFLISFSCRNRFVFPCLLEVPVIMLGLGGALFSALSALRRLDGRLYLRDHIFPLFQQSAHGWRLHLIGFCYLCNCFNQPITISCERGKKWNLETGKQRERREETESGETQGISADTLWQCFVFVLNYGRRMDCARKELSCSEVLQTASYQPDSQSALIIASHRGTSLKTAGLWKDVLRILHKFGAKHSF